MAIKVYAETGCYNPGVSILNSNTNETNTYSSSILRYPSSVSGNNWWINGYTQAQLETLYTPVDLDTCVTQGQDYFYCIIDTTGAQVQSAMSGIGLTQTRVAVPTCGIPQDIPENLIATQCKSTPTAIPFIGGTSTGTGGSTSTSSASGGTGGTAVYGSISHGSYVKSSVITCSTQAINSETGTVGGEVNPEFYVADTNCKHILIQYNSGSRKLTSGESLTFTVNEVTKVTTSGTWVGKGWTPTFNRTYGNVTYTFTAEVVRNMTDINMAHVKVGTTNARFQAEMTITGPNNLSFKVKAGRNIQTRAAIYGRWEFDQKKVYWLKQTTKPINKSSDVTIEKTNYEIEGGSGLSNSTIKAIDEATKRNSVQASGETSSQASIDSVSVLLKSENYPKQTIEQLSNTVNSSEKKFNNVSTVQTATQSDINQSIQQLQSQGINVGSSSNLTSTISTIDDQQLNLDSDIQTTSPSNINQSIQQLQSDGTISSSSSQELRGLINNSSLSTGQTVKKSGQELQSQDVPKYIFSNLNQALEKSNSGKSKNSYNIDSNKDVTKAIKDSLSVNTSTIKYEHYVKGVETDSAKKLVHTNPVSGGKNSIDSKKSLALMGVKVDVTQSNLSIAKESNFQQKSGIQSSTFQSISQANTPTAKATADILTNVHSSANTAISDINSQNESNPYNGGPGPSNNKVKEYGPVKSFDLLPKSTSTEKIQPYRYDADERMDKTFSFSLQINMFATPCGPCYTVTTTTSSGSGTGGTGGTSTSTSETCTPRSSTISSITLPFQKTFINNLTPEANRWSRITRNYQDDYQL